MAKFDELLASLFPEGAEVTAEQADAVTAMRAAYNDLETKNEQNSRWIREHMLAKPQPDTTETTEEDNRPQYERDYDYYVSHPGDFSHLTKINKE